MDVLAQLSSALKERYTVDREIGRGGMATVYLARDVRHNRKVALKVLNPELGAVLGVERFLSEIQVTANLQHPNLLPLFDSGEAGGLLFYVMPFIEGESLRALLLREKQLPIDEAVHIATSVASALDYAHRQGVIHRDLKPENILIHDGQPLVADFGIALAVSNAGGNRITQTGLSLGTPHYMSPEQATGDREIDGRTDVYSLGAVTYEMLVGEPPHDGKTSQAIIAKVLTDKPRSIRLARETVPAFVEAAVERALAKLPADRYHTAHEFADALAGKGMVFAHAASAGGTMAEVRAATRPVNASPWGTRIRSAFPWALTLLAVAAAIAGWRTVAQMRDRSVVVRYEIPLPGNPILMSDRGRMVAISADGRFIAYAARGKADQSSRLYLRAADDLQPREVSGSVGAAFPFFSPDGVWVAFWAAGQIRRAPVNGGGALPILDAPAATGATWTTSNWVVAAQGLALSRTPATGGGVEIFVRADSAHGETAMLNPLALPDGNTVLYTSNAMGGAANARIGVASLRDGSSTILDLPGTLPLGVIEGNLIYTSAAGVLMAAPFDIVKRRLTGAPVVLADQAAVWAVSPSSHAQMSSDGTLVYLSGVAQRQLALVGADGVPRTLGDPGALTWPRASPDGRRLAVAVGSVSRRDIWIYELPAGPFTRLTTEGTLNDRPEWYPDSKTVLFRSNRGSRNELWKQAVDGGSPSERVLGLGDSQVDEGVLSADGKYLVLQRDRTGNAELWYRATKGDTTLRAIESGGGSYGARFSPDGRWVAYTSTESGPEQVYVREFPSLAGRAQVSLDGGASPVWSADGQRIYYTAGGQVYAATVGSVPPFRITSRAVVLARGFTFTAVHADFDVMRDGRIVALQSPSREAQLVVVRNFAAELRARLRGTPR